MGGEGVASQDGDGYTCEMIKRTREEAWRNGFIRFYTGEACLHGHVAERYVSTGGCVECAKPFPKRRHPHDSSLLPYNAPRLWVPRGTTQEQYERLTVYLQRCVDHFMLLEQAKELDGE